MATNDSFLLDGILEERLTRRGKGVDKGTVFEELTCEQVLKEFDFTLEEIESGMVDGQSDGGIDGFYIVVNGHLLSDPESFVWPKSGADLKVVILNCKHHDTFKLNVLDKLVATMSELLNFAIPSDKLAGAYSDALLACRSNLMYAYRRLSPKLDQFNISIVYASRGDSSSVGSEVDARAQQLVGLIRQMFGSCEPTFEFVGSAELVTLFRSIPSYTLELPFVASLSKGERYVVLARLVDYFSFVSDGRKLRRYLFESNIRDYLGDNTVNQDIQSTLNQQSSPDFWLLNNGVTILATSASIVGSSIKASDIQIVNGLQTTETIHRHFLSASPANDDRCLLVKVIVTPDPAVRDLIIRATNNQSNVELSSLHATDKIQRDIEDVLARKGLWYDRRKNYYTNQGHQIEDIITPLYLAAGCVALLLKCPHSALVLRSRFMRNQEQYDSVFSAQVPLAVWPVVAKIFKRVDSELELLRPTAKTTEKYLKNYRYIVAFLIVSISQKRFTFSAIDLVTFDIATVNRESVQEVLRRIQTMEVTTKKGRHWSYYRHVVEACDSFASEYEISGRHCIPRAFGDTESLGRAPVAEAITGEIFDKIRQLLPPQPWKPGIHKAVCKEAGCSQGTYFEVVRRLIEDGIFLQQKDGVLYDKLGNVSLFDAERVDPSTMKLWHEREQ